MKHFSGFDNIFENEAWYFWGNVKVLLRHINWGLATKGPHSDPADKTCLGLYIATNVSKWSNLEGARPSHPRLNSPLSLIPSLRSKTKSHILRI